MLKKNIKYTDYDGTYHDDEYFYFFLNKVDALRLTAKYSNDLQAHAKKLIEKKDMLGMIDMFQDLILTAYGEPTPDGRSFIRTPEIRSQFQGSVAYAEYFELLLTSPDEQTAFLDAMKTDAVVEEGKSSVVQLFEDVDAPSE